MAAIFAFCLLRQQLLCSGLQVLCIHVQVYVHAYVHAHVQVVDWIPCVVSGLHPHTYTYMCTYMYTFWYVPMAAILPFALRIRDDYLFGLQVLHTHVQVHV